MMSAEMPDPMGAAIQAYWEGEKNASIEVYTKQADPDEIPVSYLFRKWEEMPEREQFALELCQGKTLDIGAGAGSHSLALQDLGKEVTALEISERSSAVMKKRGVRQVLRGDFYTLSPQPFDTLLLLMNGIGLAGTIENLPNFLATCRTWMGAQSQILLESSDILYLYEEEDGSVLIDLNSNYYGELTYEMQYKQERSKPFPWLFIDYDLLKDIAQQAGFIAELLLVEEDGHYLARLRFA